MCRRLNWGCGAVTPYGWVNSDMASGPGVEVVGDIREGLPLESGAFDYIVSIHALPEIAYADLDRALAELHRILKPEGVLRLGLPDMDKALAAYRDGEVDYFLIGDDVVRSLAGKMIVQLTWFGRSRCLFNWEFTQELLRRARFREINLCGFGKTRSRFPGIVELDNRQLESFFVEATR